MIHIFGRKPKYAISYIIFEEFNKKTKVAIEKDYKFSNLDETAVFLKHLFEMDMGVVSYFSKDETHVVKSEFYYGVKYLIEYDDIRIIAEIAEISNIAKGYKLPIFIQNNIIKLLKLKTKG